MIRKFQLLSSRFASSATSVRFIRRCTKDSLLVNSVASRLSIGSCSSHPWNTGRNEYGALWFSARSGSIDDTKNRVDRSGAGDAFRREEEWIPPSKQSSQSGGRISSEDGDYEEMEVPLPTQNKTRIGSKKSEKYGPHIDPEEIMDEFSRDIIKEIERDVTSGVPPIMECEEGGEMMLNEDLLFKKYGINASVVDFDPDADEEGWEELDISEMDINSLEEAKDDPDITPADFQNLLRMQEELDKDVDVQSLLKEFGIEQEEGGVIRNTTEKLFQRMSQQLQEAEFSDVDPVPGEVPSLKSDRQQNRSEHRSSATAEAGQGKKGEVEFDEFVEGLPMRNRHSASKPTAMMTPKDAAAAKVLNGEIPAKKGVLLSSKEVVECLQGLGARDVKVINLPAEAKIGKYMIIATGMNGSHLRTMSDCIVRAMRERNLHKMGVVGAEKGAEGRESDEWIAVDCRNIVLHLMDEDARKAVDLENLWAKGGPLEKLRNNPIPIDDQDAIEKYVRDNPISEEYYRFLQSSGQSNSSFSSSLNGPDLFKGLERAKIPPSRRGPEEDNNRGKGKGKRRSARRKGR